MTNPPFLCPVCNGKGKLNKKTCHGCEGKGWVVIPDQPKQVESTEGVRVHKKVRAGRENIPIAYYIGTGISGVCPICGRYVEVGASAKVEEKRPQKVQLPCGDMVSIVYV